MNINIIIDIGYLFVKITNLFIIDLVNIFPKVGIYRSSSFLLPLGQCLTVPRVSHKTIKQ